MLFYIKNIYFKNMSFSTFEFTTESDEERFSEKSISNHLFNAISKILNQIVHQSKKLPNYLDIIKSQEKMSFSSKKVPNISIKDYLKRIQTYSELENSTLIVSLIYIDRICQLGNIVLTSHNIHRILFCAIYLALKYNEDQIYKTDYYAQIAGISIKELNLIENEFVSLINFNFFIDDQLYSKYENYLKNFE
jgi:hypothetical protein